MHVGEFNSLTAAVKPGLEAIDAQLAPERVQPQCAKPLAMIPLVTLQTAPEPQAGSQMGASLSQRQGGIRSHRCPPVTQNRLEVAGEYGQDCLRRQAGKLPAHV
jgi:hypothetical protein